MSASAHPQLVTPTPWPLAGTEEFGRVPADWRNATADRLQRDLEQHVIKPWYPLTVDRDRGGFSTDYDRRWRPTGPDDRMLEYQARHTRTVARLGEARPGSGPWAEYAAHGRGYMNEVMRDRDDGGWFWLVDRRGAPLAGGTKHAHSTAYVIGAMVEVYRTTGDVGALEDAEHAFEWLDLTLHDDEHGGYHGWATRDGRPITSPEDVRGWPGDVEPLGHEIGLKDLNVHSDLLESFRLLHAARPSAKLRDRAVELYRIIDHNFAEPGGRMYYLVTPDLTPVPGPEHPGYAFQVGYRAPLLAQSLGMPLDDAYRLALRGVDHALRTGWVPQRGGFFEKLVEPRLRRRTWWVQTEAIEALILLEVNGQGAYLERIEQLLRLVQAEYVDEGFGGWHQVPRSDWTLIDRLRVKRWPKAHRWKDPSHETDMSLAAIRMLRGLPMNSRISAAGST